jgi:hypothetical protein
MYSAAYGPEHHVPGPALHVPGPALHVPGPALHVPGPALHVPGPALHVLCRLRGRVASQQAGTASHTADCCISCKGCRGTAVLPSMLGGWLLHLEEAVMLHASMEHVM